MRYLFVVIILVVGVSCSREQSDESAAAIAQLQQENSALVDKLAAQESKYIKTRRAMESYQVQKNQQLLHMAKLSNTISRLEQEVSDLKSR